jgi:twitching motility protein PilU
LKIKLEGLKGDDAINALLDKGPHATGETPFKLQGGGPGSVRPIRKL